MNAECFVGNHAPTCSCLPGYTGNPFTSCHLPPPGSKFTNTRSSYAATKSFSILEIKPVTEPCVPSPCGPYSQCRVVNDHAVCSCQAGYVGNPPACRPECVVSSECAQNKACISNKCQDPCPGTCGLNARCQVVNHNPICSCSAGFTGDPFVRCVPEESKNET